MLFIQIALKAKKMWSFLLVSALYVITTTQILPQLNWYVALWQLHLGCLATIIVTVKSKTSRASVSYRGNFCPSKQHDARQRREEIKLTTHCVSSVWPITNQNFKNRHRRLNRIMTEARLRRKLQNNGNTGPVAKLCCI